MTNEANRVTCECNCGAIAFEIPAAISEIYVCHCSICRRFSAGGGFPVVIVDNQFFRWLSGEEDRVVRKKHDADWEANFCKTCGSAVPGKNADTNMFVPAGLLPGDGANMHVRHHIFVASKPHWVEIRDGGTQHAAHIQP